MIRVHYSELQDCLRAGIDLDNITITGLEELSEVERLAYPSQTIFFVHYAAIEQALDNGIHFGDITITGLDDVTLEQKCSIYNSIISLLKYRELQA